MKGYKLILILYFGIEYYIQIRFEFLNYFCNKQILLNNVEERQNENYEKSIVKTNCKHYD